MADDHASKIVRTEMNECLNLESGEGRANDRFWVWPEAVGQGVFAQL